MASSAGITVDRAAHIRVAMAIYGAAFEQYSGAIPDLEKLWRQTSPVQRAYCLRQAAAAIGAFLAPLAQQRSDGGG